MDLELLIARQAGVVSRAQARRAGLTGSGIDRRLRTRRWRPLHPRVYLDRDRAGPRDEVQVWSAVLWAGEGAVLCGAAAAWWHGLLDRAPPTARVALPAGRAPRARPGVSAAARPLGAVDLTRLRGVVVTVAPVSVLDAAVELGAAGVRLLERAPGMGVAPADIVAAHRRHRDAPGARTAARMLAAVVGATPDQQWRSQGDPAHVPAGRGRW